MHYRKTIKMVLMTTGTTTKLEPRLARVSIQRRTFLSAARRRRRNGRKRCAICRQGGPGTSIAACEQR